MSVVRREHGLLELGDSVPGSTTASVMFGPNYKGNRFQVFVSVTLPAHADDIMTGNAAEVATSLAEAAAEEALNRILPKFVAFVDDEEPQRAPWG